MIKEAAGEEGKEDWKVEGTGEGEEGRERRSKRRRGSRRRGQSLWGVRPAREVNHPDT